MAKDKGYFGRETEDEAEVKADEPTAEDQPGQPQASGGKYRLLTQHIIAGAIYPAGTEVGADTDIAFEGTPSNQMEGLNEEGKNRVNELHQQLYGKQAPWHDRDHQSRDQIAQYAPNEEQRKVEVESEPVSHQQAFERGVDYKGNRVNAPQPVHTEARTIGGDRSQPMGPATPVQEPMRPTRPVEEQLPKS